MSLTATLRRPFGALRRRVLGAVTHVETTEPVVALTFDDGPDPRTTPRFLDLLARHQVQATFFMVGEAARRHRDLVRRVADAGHAIGNHTWNHPSLPLLSRRERIRQIRAAQRALAPFARKLFRPPFGNLNRISHLDAALLGYTVVTWNVVGMDWQTHGADWLVAHLYEQIRPGAIVLLHDALYARLDGHCADRGPLLAALEQLLSKLRDRYRFVTVPDLCRAGKPIRQEWLQEPQIEFLKKLQSDSEEAWVYSAR